MMSQSTPTVPWWQRLIVPLAASRLGGWFLVRVAPSIDRLFLRLSGGRLSTTIGYPTLILTTIGAKTGQPRVTPLIYLPLDSQIILLASNGGNPRNPGWYYNLRTYPEATVFTKGRTATYVALEAQGAEREDLWRKAAAMYPGYITYQRRATSRQIPVMVLTPQSP